jgi:Zn finger protein HypA/HybF involved in hydrogenase expression
MSGWVAIQARPGVAHRLAETTERGSATAECGSRIELPDFDPPGYLPECRLCAEHTYARAQRTFCPHCHKRPA